MTLLSLRSFTKKRFKRTENIFFCFVCSLRTSKEHFCYRLAIFRRRFCTACRQQKRKHHKNNTISATFLLWIEGGRKPSIRGIQIRIILAVGCREGRGGEGCQQQQQHYRTNQPTPFLHFSVSTLSHSTLAVSFSKKRKRKGGKLMSLSRKKRRRNRT